MVRNGHHKARKIVTGAGQLDVSVPRVDDRVLAQKGEERFQSSLVPPYLRRTKNIEELVPLLYLKGISTGDFTEVIEKLTGRSVVGFSPENVVRMKQVWQKEYSEWNNRDLRPLGYEGLKSF